MKVQLEQIVQSSVRHFFLNPHCNLITMFKHWTAKDAASKVCETWRWRLGREEPSVAAPMLGRWTFTPSNRGAACSQCVGFTNFGEGDVFFCCRTVAPEIRTVANLQCFLGFLEMDGISFFLGFLEMDGISFNLHMSPTSALMASWHRKAPSTFVICLKLWPFAAVLHLQTPQGTLLPGCTMGWPADDQMRVRKTFLFLLYALGFCRLTQTMLWADLYLPIYPYLSISLSLKIPIQSNPIQCNQIQSNLI